MHSAPPDVPLAANTQPLPRGWYVDIPILSEATYLQVEDAERMDRSDIEGQGP